MTVSEKVAVATSTQSSGGLLSWLAFGVCAGLLAMTTVAAIALQRYVRLDRDPAPLRKDLGRLDKSQLGPYRFLESDKLSDEVVEVLGTHDYIQWRLEDTRRPPGDPLGHASLFVTYYTGGPTQVPHTPERCFIGANFELGKTWPVHFELSGVEDTGGPKDVFAKALVFTKPGPLADLQQVVVYTFYANCEYASERNYIRIALMNRRYPKAFFSKVEVVYSGGGTGASAVDPQKAALAAQDLMQTVLPVLMREHWPRPADLTAQTALNEASAKKEPVVP